jgi:thioredoxin reductase (NADPH)
VAKPAILAVDDDPAVLQAITRDLRRQYGSEYQVLRAPSGAEALKVLAELELRERPVALIASDQRMPAMTGVEFLGTARSHAPEAKLVLVTAYADIEVAIEAINDLGLDYYLMKPWDPPTERLYPVLDDLLSDWRRAHVDELGGVRVVGHRWSERSNEIKTFLARNHVPYRWLDVERDAEALRIADLANAEPADLPLVFVPDGDTLRGPSLIDLADALGLRTRAEQPLYDLCIVGGGPAGLAAAVYGASEGLQTVVVEREAPGGQAGQSSLIENYLGCPSGVAGFDLAQRALGQARRFGAELVVAREVESFRERGPVRAVCLTGAPRRAGARRVHGARRLLRRVGEPGQHLSRPRRLHRGRRELGRAGRAGPRPLRATRRAARALGLIGEVDVSLPRRADRGRAEHRSAPAE